MLHSLSHTHVYFLTLFEILKHYYNTFSLSLSLKLINTVFNGSFRYLHISTTLPLVMTRTFKPLTHYCPHFSDSISFTYSIIGSLILELRIPIYLVRKSCKCYVANFIVFLAYIDRSFGLKSSPCSS